MTSMEPFIPWAPSVAQGSFFKPEHRQFLPAPMRARSVYDIKYEARS